MVSTLFIGLVVVALLAGWNDVRNQRIPNVLTVGAAGAALVLRALEGGTEMFVSGLLGLAIAFAIMVPLFAVGAMGGGDVKLLAAIGAFLGLGRLFPGLLAIAVAGGIVAVVVAIRHGELAETVRRAARLPARFLLPPRLGKDLGGASTRTIDTPGVLTIPYGIPIGLGAVVAWMATGVA